MAITLRSNNPTAVTGSTGAVTPPITHCYAGDFMLLLVETANQAVVNDAALVTAGWTKVVGTHPGTGTAAGTASTLLAAYWKIHDGTETAPALGDAGDHTVGVVLAFRGVDSADPLAATSASDVAATASTSVTFPAVTTDVANALVVNCLARATDSAAAQTSAQANASLTGVAERFDAGSTAGNGGGITVITGTKVAAGASGSTTCTLATSSVQARITLALNPAAEPPPLSPPHVPNVAQEFYVDPVAGNDATGTGTSGSPWQTFAGAISNLSSGVNGAPASWTTSGDVALNLKPGTYQGSSAGALTVQVMFANANRAPRFDRWFIVRPWPGESGDVIVKPPDGVTGAKTAIQVFHNGSTFFGAYTQIRDLRVTGDGSPRGGGDVVGIWANTAPYVEVVGCEVDGLVPNAGTTKAQGLYADGPSADFKAWWNDVHDIGVAVGSIDIQEHGIYAGGDFSQIVGNLMRNFPNGYAIQVYDSNRAISDCRVCANTIVGVTSIEKSGVIVPGQGSRNVVANNIVVDPAQYGVEFFPATFTGAGNVADDNIVFSPGIGSFSTTPSGGWTVTSTGTADPLLDAGFMPGAGSAAIGAANPDYVPTVDLFGTDRSTSPSIGAVEFVTGASYVDAAATISAVSSVSAAGSRSRSAAATVVGGSVMSAAASRSRSVVAAVAGVSAVSAVGSRSRSGVAVVVGSSAALAVGSRLRSVGAGVAGVSSMNVAAVRGRSASATISGASSLSAAAARVRDAAALVAAVGGVSAAAGRVRGVAASVDAVAGVAASAARLRGAAATISGASGFDAHASAVRSVSATVGAASSWSIIATSGRVIDVAAVIAATSGFAATATRARSVAAEIDASSGVAAIATRSRSAVATIAAASDVEAAAVRVRSVAATVEGSSGLGAVGARVRLATATVEGTSSIAATAKATRSAAATVSGMSSVSASARVVRSAAASIVGVSAFGAYARRSRGVSAVIAGLSGGFAVAGSSGSWIGLGASLHARPRFAGVVKPTPTVEASIRERPATSADIHIGG